MESIKIPHKGVMAVLAVLIVAVSLARSCQIVESRVKRATGELSVNATFGFDGHYIVGQKTPISFAITNNGPARHAQITIDLPLNQYEKAEYVVDFDIAQAETKQINAELALDSSYQQITYRIISEQTELFRSSLKHLQPISAERPVFVIITQNSDNYSEFSNLQFYKATDHVPATSPTMPSAVSEKTALNFSDVYLIYSTDLSNLIANHLLAIFDGLLIASDAHIQLVDEDEIELVHWLEQGGSLFIEGGKNYQTLAKQLPNSLKQIDFERYLAQDFNPPVSHLPTISSVQSVSGKVIRKNIETLQIASFLAGYRETIGKGQLVSLTTSLANEAAQHLNRHCGYFNYLVNYFELDQQRLSPPVSLSNNGNIMRALNYIPIQNEWPLTFISYLLIAYVFIVGPLLYLVLKHFDKRLMLWPLAPLIALLVIVIIYGIGQRTSVNQPIVNQLSLINYDVNQNRLDVSSRLTLFNNRNSAMEISWQDEDLRLILTNHHQPASAQSNNLVTAYRQNIGARPSFVDAKASLWDSRHFEATKQLHLPASAQGQASLTINEGGAFLIVDNQSPLTLTDAVLFYNGSLFSLGTIQSAQRYEKSLDQLDSVSPYHLYSERVNPNDSDYKLEIYQQLLDYFLQDDHPSDQATLYALTDYDLHYQLQINRQTPFVFSRNVVQIPLKISIEKGVTVKLDNSFTRQTIYTIDDGKPIQHEFYREAGGRVQVTDIHQTDTVYSEIKLPELFDVQSIQLDLNNYYRYPGDHRPQDLADQYFIYNVQTESYLAVDKHAIVAETDALWLQLEPGSQLDQANTIRIKTIKDPNYHQFDNYMIKAHDIWLEGVYRD